MRKANFQKGKEFVKALISHFIVSTKATHFGVITYSTYAKLEFDFANTKYYEIVELKKRVMEIAYPGKWTRTDRALEMAAQKLFTDAGGDRKDKPNVLIVLTDGKTNRGSKPYPEVLRPLQVCVQYHISFLRYLRKEIFNGFAANLHSSFCTNLHHICSEQM